MPKNWEARDRKLGRRRRPTMDKSIKYLAEYLENKFNESVKEKEVVKDEVTECESGGVSNTSN